jgi:hypothetical protein
LDVAENGRAILTMYSGITKDIDRADLLMRPMYETAPTQLDRILFGDPRFALTNRKARSQEKTENSLGSRA